MRKTISAQISRELSAESHNFRLENLVSARREMVPGSEQHSVHILLTVDDLAAAYCRLTWGEHAPVQNNPLIRGLLPKGIFAADLIDGVVAPDFRSLGLYNLIAALAVQAAAKAGRTHFVLSASSANGLTPVMQTWPVLRQDMLGINPYSESPLDLFLVAADDHQIKRTLPLKLSQIEIFRARSFEYAEHWSPNLRPTP